MEIAFYVLAVSAILSAMAVVFAKSPVYSVLWLILTFFTIAGQYVLLNAQFLAAVHVIVYAGAIMVLFLFVIMLLNLNIATEPVKPVYMRAYEIIGGCVLCLTMVAAIHTSSFKFTPVNAYDNSIGTIEKLGITLYNNYFFVFEVSSLLFLAAMIGAVILAKKGDI
ncbi:NADH-quinone oxidoreductase subunit J [Sphingobacteriales bacterium UPWRP_1]|nr:NADH-quinone oxidoreductase subunit J [Sphingobacteriales bacterium UPWRP_1]